MGIALCLLGFPPVDLLRAGCAGCSPPAGPSQGPGDEDTGHTDVSAAPSNPTSSQTDAALGPADLSASVRETGTGSSGSAAMVTELMSAVKAATI